MDRGPRGWPPLDFRYALVPARSYVELIHVDVIEIDDFLDRAMDVVERIAVEHLYDSNPLAVGRSPPGQFDF